jgi:hypothetical protein
VDARQQRIHQSTPLSGRRPAPSCWRKKFPRFQRKTAAEAEPTICLLLMNGEVPLLFKRGYAMLRNLRLFGFLYGFLNLFDNLGMKRLAYMEWYNYSDLVPFVDPMASF